MYSRMNSIKAQQETNGGKKRRHNRKFNKEIYFSMIDKMALDAFDDQCTSSNPKLPLVYELKEIYGKIYE